MEIAIATPQFRTKANRTWDTASSIGFISASIRHHEDITGMRSVLSNAGRTSAFARPQPGAGAGAHLCRFCFAGLHVRQMRQPAVRDHAIQRAMLALPACRRLPGEALE